MPRLALTDSEKQQRRQVLLDAAHQLFREQHEIPTVAAIAERADVGKGTVYLSFRTKEQIFIALLSDSFLGFIAQLKPLFPYIDSPATFAKHYTEHLLAQPDLLELAAMANTVLETNLPQDTLLAFKQQLAQAVAECATLLAPVLQVPVLQCQQLLTRTWSLTVGLYQGSSQSWQLQHVLPPEVYQQLFPDYRDELESSVRQLWLGFLADVQSCAR